MLDKDEKLLTIKETIEMAQISRFSLYRDIKSGKLPALYFGKNVRIKESDAIAYAEEKSKSKRVAYYKNKDGC